MIGESGTEIDMKKKERNRGRERERERESEWPEEQSLGKGREEKDLRVRNSDVYALTFRNPACVLNTFLNLLFNFILFFS